jgi:hypothetical protein
MRTKAALTLSRMCCSCWPKAGERSARGRRRRRRPACLL